MRIRGRIYIGTSGWHYRHWIGNFYPEGTKNAEQLTSYIKTLDTVEINNSFYKLPAAATFDSWRKATPAGFRFSVKASRFITHMKKLNVDRESIVAFLGRADHLQAKLGPILFQLPPNWKRNVERLEALLKKLPRGYRFAFEFRDPDWYDAEVYELLRRFRVAFCVYELDHHQSPIMATANFVYVRLHGPGGKYQGNYTKAVLRKWAGRCRKWAEEKKDVYFYFDNDQAGYAAYNAKDLSKLVNGS